MLIWLEFVWRALLMLPFLAIFALLTGARTIGEIRVTDFLFVVILAGIATSVMTNLDTLWLGAIIAMIVVTAAYYLLSRFRLMPSDAMLAAYARRSGVRSQRRAAVRPGARGEDGNDASDHSGHAGS